MRNIFKRFFSKEAKILCGAVALWALQGCATSQLTGVWSDPKYSGGPIESMVIVGLSDKAANRRLFEQEFSLALKQLGLKSIASETLIPDVQKVSKEEATKIIRNSGLQAAIVARTESIDTRTETIPGRVEYVRGGSFGSSFPGQYGHTAVYIDPEEIQYTVVRVETSLYDLKTEKCLWSATSEAVDPKNVDILIESIIKTVIKDLQNKKLLPIR